ncbi:MAG: M23 family metallopeptidase [Oscillospiraceae bacterium]
MKEGQKIAEVGETGVATGPHLHFELQKNGTYLNPIYYVD